MEETTILIFVTSITQDESGQEEKVEYTTVGTLLKTQDGFSLTYDENAETSIVGKNTVRVKGDAVIIERDGETALRMLLREGYKFLGDYHTPYGDLALEVLPITVEAQLKDENEGSVKLGYHMTVQNTYVGLNRLDVRFHPRRA